MSVGSKGDKSWKQQADEIAAAIIKGDDIVLGGPDPFPKEGRGDCPAQSSGPWGYLCTRDAGHEPPHVACAGATTGVVAVWPPYRELL